MANYYYNNTELPMEAILSLENVMFFIVAEIEYITNFSSSIAVIRLHGRCGSILY